MLVYRMRNADQATDQERMEAFRYYVLNPLAPHTKSVQFQQIVQKHLSQKSLDGMHTLIQHHVYSYFCNQVSDIELACQMYFAKNPGELEAYNWTRDRLTWCLPISVM